MERSSVYTLAQGPITVDFNDDYEEKDDPAPQTLDTEGSKFKGPSLVMAPLQKHWHQFMYPCQKQKTVKVMTVVFTV